MIVGNFNLTLPLGEAATRNVQVSVPNSITLEEWEMLDQLVRNYIALAVAAREKKESSNE